MPNELSNKKQVKWYDKISSFYDFFTAGLYQKARQKLIEDLDIKKGDRVLVIACGTGQSFSLIHAKTGSEGEIIALDYSPGMLKVAQKRIGKRHWKNISLLQMDVRDLDREYLLNRGIQPGFDVLVGELAFSVIPDWKNVMKKGKDLLNTNVKVGLMDWFRKKNNWLTWVVDTLAEAETRRNTAGYARKIFIPKTTID